jgi:GT2 family glycosyltransferase
MPDDRQDNLESRLRKAEGRLASVAGELEAYRAQRAALLTSLRKTTQSPSWRVTGVLRRLKRLVRPGRLTHAELTPATPMEAGEVLGGLAATKQPPQLLLPCVPVSGWVRVRVSLQCQRPSHAHLYWDSGSLFNEAEHLELGPVGPSVHADPALPPPVSTFEVLHHLPSPVHCFRLDPMRLPGEFVVRSLEITPLSGLAVDTVSLAKRVRWYFSGGPWKTSLPNGLKLLAKGDLHGFRAKLRGVLGSAAVGAQDYELWRRRNVPDRNQLDALTRRDRELVNPPRISVLVPTYNTPERLLRECIESVLNQSYPHLELCVADDCSPEPHVRRVIEEYAGKDSRVKAVFRESNGHIAAASNSALEVASGEYVALLDHDDTLAPHALSSVAREILADPSLDMLYSDEDKLTEAGHHLDPFFKPDWSPEFFLACMYTCHLGVYRTGLVREIGGFRSEFDQAQDYDLVLRLTRRTQRIRHIPDVLYHWRITAASTAGGAEAKPLAHHRAQAAIRDHLAALGEVAEVLDGPAAGYHRVRYAVVGEPHVVVVIPSACKPLDFAGRTDFWARRCADSLRKKATWKHLTIVVIGPEGVPNELEAALRDLGVVRATYGKPFNFSQACNAGASAGLAAAPNAEHVLFLNDDTEVDTPGFVEEMLSFAQRPGVGAVGAKLLFPDGLLQHVGVTVLAGNPGHVFYRYPGDHPGFFFSSRVHRNWSAVTAACMLVPRAAFEEVGGFDVRFPLNFNDVDLCLRLVETGRRIVFTPFAQLIHHESVTKPGTFDHELLNFHDRWKSVRPHDPYYNRNLSYDYGDFRIQT